MHTERVEFVVVGAGLLGLATARALHTRGREVVVLEQATVGHERAGSKGATRIFRLGYTDPKYVRMAMATRPLWDALDPTLLTTTGQLTFGAGMHALHRAMTDAGAPIAELSAGAVRERFPAITIPGDALYEPDSAVIDAARTLEVLRDGIDVREHTRVVGVSDGDRATVHFDGGSIDTNVAIVCPGPWSPDFVAGTFATLEHVAYFRPLIDTPIFIEFAEPAPYGLPTPQLDAYKLALHHAGGRVDATDADFTPDPEQVAALQAVARRLFPQLDPNPVRVETCLYDNTPTEDFILRRDGSLVIGAGTSGHGFKFGPLLGEKLADLAMRA